MDNKILQNIIQSSYFSFTLIAKTTLTINVWREVQRSEAAILAIYMYVGSSDLLQLTITNSRSKLPIIPIMAAPHIAKWKIEESLLEIVKFIFMIITSS